jgi:Tfp pilus assembly protein PilN
MRSRRSWASWRGNGRPDMLRANLSTRPFYNERGVHGVLGIVAFIVLMFTIFNLTQIVLLTRRQSSLSSQAEAADARAADLRARAVRTRQAINAKQLDSISNAAREANTIIGQRLFSWTVLLNHLGDALPANVRITALRPNVDRDGSITVAMTVFAESVEEIEQFMTNLEDSTAFSEVYPIDDEPAEGGGVRASLAGKYAPAP